MKKSWIARIATIVMLAFFTMLVACADGGESSSESSQPQSSTPIESEDTGDSSDSSEPPQNSSGTWSDVFLPPMP